MFTSLSNPLLLRRVGVTLFGLSFLTPNWRFGGIGVSAFLIVPEMVGNKLLEGDVFHDWHMIVLMGSLSLGWLSNFTVFYSLPPRAAAIAITAPWILFGAMIFLSRIDGPDIQWLG